jgi:hypothetical protein
MTMSPARKRLVQFLERVQIFALLLLIAIVVMRIISYVKPHRP